MGSTSDTETSASGFSEQERAAMKERSAEFRRARRPRRRLTQSSNLMGTIK